MACAGHTHGYVVVHIWEADGGVSLFGVEGRIPQEEKGRRARGNRTALAGRLSRGREEGSALNRPNARRSSPRGRLAQAACLLEARPRLGAAGGC